MAKLSPHLSNVKKNYLFDFVAHKKKEHLHPGLVDLGIGDISLPLSKTVAEAIKSAVDEMTSPSSLRGYGPECGYDFLQSAILNTYYPNLGFSIDEILINDGIISDIVKMPLLFDSSSQFAVQNPSFPPYLENLKIHGLIEQTEELSSLRENQFKPSFPKQPADIIFLCSPHNPTGIALSRADLTDWVSYAKKHNSIILFDAAYQAFIQNPETPRSIYEIEGAREVAIEFMSFSKSAGFTGLRCGFFVCPKELHQSRLFLDSFMHAKAISTNGVSYPIQKGALAALSEPAKSELEKDRKIYMESTKLLKDALVDYGFEIYGGEDCPYIWLKVPTAASSLEFFEYLLTKHDIVCVPGSGFGSFGEGYVRLSGFMNHEKALKAIEHFQGVKSACLS